MNSVRSFQRSLTKRGEVSSTKKVQFLLFRSKLTVV